jgi:peroxiredoxin
MNVMTFSFGASYVALWVLAIFQGLLLLAVLRKVSELRGLVEGTEPLNLDQVPVGDRAPEFAAVDSRSNRTIDIRVFEERGGMIVFLSPDCSACKAVGRGLQAPANATLPPIVVVCIGRELGCERIRKLLGQDVFLVSENTDQIGLRYGVNSFPTAVVIDRQKRIRAYANPATVGDLLEVWAHAQNSAVDAEHEGDGVLLGSNGGSF